MKKLYGLKDEDGKDVVLNIESVYGRKTATAFDIVEIKTVEKEPEFKVGQWATDGLIQGRIVNTGYDGGLVYLEDVETKTQYTINVRNLTHMTPAEIKAHLKKICDEKYVGKKVNGLVCEWSGEIRHFSESDFTYQYDDPSVDRFWMKNTENVWVCVYDAGKFAEILPSKKKLPKTKEELRQFFEEFADRDQGDFNFFLDQYED